MAKILVWKLVILSGLAWCASALADRAMGDIAVDPPPMPAGRKLVVKVDPRADVSKLILPADMQGGPGVPVPAPRAPSAEKGAFWSPTRTMMAGLCLSLAIASLIFVRTTSGGTRVLLIAVATMSAVGIGAVAWADVPGPFPRPRPQPRPQPVVPIAEAVQLAEGQVTIEYTNAKDAPITLVLSGKSVGGVFRLPPGAPAPVLPPGAAPRAVPNIKAFPAPEAPAPAP